MGQIDADREDVLKRTPFMPLWTCAVLGVVLNCANFAAEFPGFPGGPSLCRSMVPLVSLTIVIVSHWGLRTRPHRSLWNQDCEWLLLCWTAAWLGVYLVVGLVAQATALPYPHTLAAGTGTVVMLLSRPWLNRTIAAKMLAPHGVSNDA
jgi:hypothetical protein